jgi:hypothetical protein
MEMVLADLNRSEFVGEMSLFNSRQCNALIVRGKGQSLPRCITRSSANLPCQTRNLYYRKRADGHASAKD